MLLHSNEILTFKIPVDIDFIGTTVELILEASCSSKITQGNSYNKHIIKYLLQNCRASNMD